MYYSISSPVTTERFFSHFVTETVTDFWLEMTSAHDKNGKHEQTTLSFCHIFFDSFGVAKLNKFC